MANNSRPNADNVQTGDPVAIGDSNSSGASNALAKAEHVHAHGSQTNPAHHAVATTESAGFLSSTDKSALEVFKLTIEKLGIFPRFKYPWQGGLYAGGALVANTQYVVDRGGSQGDCTIAWSTEAEVTVNGSQAIQIRIATPAGTTTVTGRYLTLERVA